ncbi:hypothetical protein MHM83_10995 [Tenacibaculum sp. Mcav3-52]|uniref:hypothetical protein n=1 Tax=Tenacibaculum sp. Mcav3-52 TaxID=2917762 RepID=UPI001EF191C5|nr:hypothetical protein [Tenacibaculum sp. Mcav3-52]MCG7502399.1 hypothetical protein [Tenacibaculum sp. Mcav3-52]
MTKKELIKALEPFDDNMDVFIDERTTDFTYGLLSSVKKQKVIFSEDSDSVSELNAEGEVIVLSEEY